ncbi:hypothetical protein NHF46_22210 [Arthrobacter alpinus]|nr:hypothetical protein [Arthrobacter alpinus]
MGQGIYFLDPMMKGGHAGAPLVQGSLRTAVGCGAEQWGELACSDV